MNKNKKLAEHLQLICKGLFPKNEARGIEYNTIKRITTKHIMFQSSRKLNVGAYLTIRNTNEFIADIWPHISDENKDIITGLMLGLYE